ncbi:DUF1573 domain-containing protein [Maioricimonas sp. JC845]|uniref:DUF1573 domain-containing protein n=1 Tax=Maioricimonas sp. JC845 TaxID=3232138 RepID=UPI00345ACB2E
MRSFPGLLFRPTSSVSVGLQASRHRILALRVAILVPLALVVLFVAVYAVTGSSALVLPWLRGERVLVDPAVVHLGVLPRDAGVVDVRVRVVNLHSSPVRLLGAQRSCGCISLGRFPVEISSGEVQAIAMRVAVPERPETIDESVTLFANVSGVESLTVRIVGRVE